MTRRTPRDFGIFVSTWSRFSGPSPKRRMVASATKQPSMHSSDSSSTSAAGWSRASNPKADCRASVAISPILTVLKPGDLEAFGRHSRSSSAKSLGPDRKVWVLREVLGPQAGTIWRSGSISHAGTLVAQLRFGRVGFRRTCSSASKRPSRAKAQSKRFRPNSALDFVPRGASLDDLVEMIAVIEDLVQQAGGSRYCWELC